MPVEQKIVKLSDGGEKVIHCPSCHGVLLKLHGHMPNQGGKGKGEIEMKCPHCQKKLKLDFESCLMISETGEEEKKSE